MNPCTIAGTRDVGDGCHLDFGTRTVNLGGTLQSATTGGSFAVSAGELVLTAGKIRSTGPAGFAGGEVTVTVAGLFRMTGSGPALDVGGAAGGGVLSVDAARIEVLSGSVGADGTGTEACGGVIYMNALAGPLLLAAPVHATGNFLCSGGYLELTGQTVEVRSALNVTGGDYPGGVALTAEAGDLLLTGTASVKANGQQIDFEDGGDGGAVWLTAESGNVSLLGSVETDGASPEGEAGSITVVAGGTITATGLLTAQGNGGGSNGGTIEIDAGGDVSLDANVRATGGSVAGGGEIDVRSDGIVSLGAGKTVQANGGFFGAGSVTVRDAASIVAAGTIEARGASGGNGGIVTLETCRATVAGMVDVTAGSGGVAGVISLTSGVLQVTAGGRLLATPCDAAACTAITLPAGAPAIDPLAILTPPPAVAIDAGFAPCCGNATLEPGETCDDANGASCDGCSRLCQAEPVPACPSDGNPCTEDCSPASGCTYEPLVGQACADDGNACTRDFCGATGQCQHPPLVCNDGLACTVDSCSPGVGCVVTPDHARCDDGDTCTSESCVPGSGCAYVVEQDGTPCDDRNLCTTEDACEAGDCRPQGPPLACDDGDACTEDSCTPALGCRNVEDAETCPCSEDDGAAAPGTPCADGNDCTVDDRCDGAGSCTPGAFCPDAGNACTTNSCLVLADGGELCLAIDDGCVKSCAGAADGTPCSDGSACTSSTCQGGACVADAPGCGDGDPCNGVDYCVAAVGCRTSAPPPSHPLCEVPTAPLDSFACYRAGTAKGSPRFAARLGVPVADLLGDGIVDVRRPRAICLPGDLAGGDPSAPEHPDKLEGYQVRLRAGTPNALPRTNLEVVNELGSVRLDLKKLERVLIPVALGVDAPPVPPAPPDPAHFGCYKVAVTPGTPRFLPVFGLALGDAFGDLRVDLKRPLRLCLPLDLDGGDPGAPTRTARLLCYQAKTSSGTPRFAMRRGLFVDGPLGAERLDAVSLAEVCVPSAVHLP